MHGFRIRTLTTCAVALAGLFAAAASHAALIQTYNDESAFLADTGASAQPEIPDAGAQGTSATLGDLTFSTARGRGSEIFFGTGGTLAWDHWSTRLPGNDIAISGPEDLDIALSLASPAFSAGFRFHEPTNSTQPPNGCNAPCIDSTFRIDLLDAGSSIGSMQFKPIQDQATFFGVWTDTAFDELRITELTGGIDNEYFGRFFTGTRPVPLPGTLALLLVGLGGWAVAARRRDAGGAR